MNAGDGFVVRVLRSPFHRLMSGATDLVRYTGRRSGREITTPTMYAPHGDGIVILVARPEAKTWWRNFTEAHDIDVLVRRHWRPMTACTVTGEAAGPLIEAYTQRFPKTSRLIRRGGVVLISCTPRRARPDQEVAA